MIKLVCNVILLLVIAITTSYSQCNTAILSPKLSRKKQVDTLYTIALNLFKQRKIDSSSKILICAATLAHQNNYKSKLFEIYTRRARNTVQSTFDQKEMRRYLDSADYYKTLNKIPNAHYENILAHYMYYTNIGEYDKALQYAFAQEEHCKKYAPEILHRVYLSFGELFYRTENYTKSEEYYLKSYHLLKNSSSRMDRGIVLFNLNKLYQTTKNAERYTWYLKEYNAFLEERPDKFLNDESHSIFLPRSKNINQNEQLRLLKQSKQLQVDNQNIENIYIVNLYIIHLLMEQNKYDEAISNITENKKIIESKTMSSLHKLKNETLLYQCYKMKKDLLNANIHADAILTIKEEISNANYIRSTAEIEAKYQNEKKVIEIDKLQAENDLKSNNLRIYELENKVQDKELRSIQLSKKNLEIANTLKDKLVSNEQKLSEALAKENKLKQNQLQKELQLKNIIAKDNLLKQAQLKKLKRTRIYLMAFGAFALILSGLTLLSYLTQRKKNKIIQNQSKELETLMKEIHHRVKNNLQVVSGLLELQSHSVADPKTSMAIMEGKNRIQSMSLIHQNLYTENNSRGIDVKPYLDNLIHSICTSYNLDNKQINIVLDVEHLQLDLDTMVPIGLILNELITNSIKYAFPNIEKKELFVSLKEKDKLLHLQVRDNGPGLPKDINVQNTQTFGLKLIRSFAQKLKAKLEIKNQNGTVVDLLISKYKKA